MPGLFAGVRPLRISEMGVSQEDGNHQISPTSFFGPSALKFSHTFRGAAQSNQHAAVGYIVAACSMLAATSSH